METFFYGKVAVIGLYILIDKKVSLVYLLISAGKVLISIFNLFSNVAIFQVP